MSAPAHRERVVLAYDGSDGATAAIAWLAARGLETVTLTLDLGQGDELLGIRERALASGAVRAHVLDVREEFAHRFVLPLLQAATAKKDLARAGANAARTLLAQQLLGVARMESAGAVAHGGGAGSPLDAALLAADPKVPIVHTPPATTDEPIATLIGRYVEARNGDSPVADAFALTRRRDDCPREPAFVSIDVDNGVPVRANGIDMSLVELFDSLETIGGAHGVGRREGRTREGRQYYSEAPAAAVLQAVFGALPRGASGSVRLRLHDGECAVTSVTPSGRANVHPVGR